MYEAPKRIETVAPKTGYVAPPSGPRADIDFREIESILWRGKATILASMAASLALGLLFVLFAPRQFTSATEILIEPTDLHAVANELNLSNQVSDNGLLQVDSEVRVLTSDQVLRRVVSEQRLDSDQEFVGGSWLRRLLDGVTKGSGLGADVVADKSLIALNALKGHIRAKRAESTYVVDLSVTSGDPEKATRIANAIAQAYFAEQTEVRSDAARQVSQSLSARLQELQDRVREAEDRAEAFKAQNNIVSASGQLVNEQRLTELTKLLEAARARTAEAKARVDAVERLQQSKGQNDGAFAEAVQSSTISALRSQYAEIMRLQAEQTTVLGPRHPAVVEIQAQAERLRGMIDDEINRVALSARSGYESAKANEEALTRNFDALKQNAIATNEALVTLRELDRNVEASRSVYEAFLMRARETGEQERVDTKNIQVISKAEPPQGRSWPPSNLFVALGSLFLGAAAGSGVAFARAARLGGSRRGFAGKAELG
jgi:uncharacterized protein involved in exopolysaccharide biosynthesis